MFYKWLQVCRGGAGARRDQETFQLYCFPVSFLSHPVLAHNASLINLTLSVDSIISTCTSHRSLLPTFLNSWQLQSKSLAPVLGYKFKFLLSQSESSSLAPTTSYSEMYHIFVTISMNCHTCRQIINSKAKTASSLQFTNQEAMLTLSLMVLPPTAFTTWQPPF